MNNKHYELASCEAIDVIEDVIGGNCLSPAQSFAVGNALKYLLRLGKKDSIESDLLKAENYLHRARTGEWLADEARGGKSANAKLEPLLSSDAIKNLLQMWCGDGMAARGGDKQ